MVRRRRPGLHTLTVPAASARILEAMSVRPIVLLGDPRLRLKGERVDSFGKYLHELLDDLTDSMRHPPGVGLAAPRSPTCPTRRARRVAAGSGPPCGASRFERVSSRSRTTCTSSSTRRSS